MDVAPDGRSAWPVDRDVSAQRVAVVGYEPQAQPGLVLADLVEEQARRPVAVDDDDVQIAVVVDVTEGSGAADFGRLEDRAGLGGDLRERAVAEVVEELVGLPQGVGIALPDQRVHADHGAVDDEKVEP